MAEKFGGQEKRGGNNTIRNCVLPLLDIRQLDSMASRTAVILIGRFSKWIVLIR